MRGMRIVNKLGWVPNVFTLGNLWLGFYSTLVSLTSSGNEELLRLAGLMIVLAVLADGLDGFAARLLNARSDLGAQLDSLADLTTFGIAPAALMYGLFLHDLDYELVTGSRSIIIPTGMLLSGLYPACAAFRLAKFNVAHDDDFFTGLPSPVAGLIIALMPLAFQEGLVLPRVVASVVFVVVAYLMVSPIRYSKVQVTFLRRFSPLRLALIIIFLLGVLAFAWIRYGFEFAAAGLFGLMIVYIASGIIAFLFFLLHRASGRSKNHGSELSDPDES